jgi:hypothetical protein
VCTGIALAWSELPTELIGRYKLQRRMHERGGERELRFLLADREPLLPVWHESQLCIVGWGNMRGHSRCLPRSGWIWREELETGLWANTDAQKVIIPATLGLEKGVWFRIRQGIHGLLVSDECKRQHVYMLCDTPTHYYRVMTRCDRMPLLVEEVI